MLVLLLKTTRIGWLGYICIFALSSRGCGVLVLITVLGSQVSIPMELFGYFANIPFFCSVSKQRFFLDFYRKEKQLGTYLETSRFIKYDDDEDDDLR